MGLHTEQHDTFDTDLSLCTLLLERIPEKNSGMGLYIESDVWIPATHLWLHQDWGGKVKVTLNNISHIKFSWMLEQPLACSNLSRFKRPFGTPPHLGISKTIVLDYIRLLTSASSSLFKSILLSAADTNMPSTFMQLPYDFFMFEFSCIHWAAVCRKIFPVILRHYHLAKLFLTFR